MRATLTRLTQVTGDPLAAGDGPLLDAFLAGDEAAFARLVRRHAGLVFATCRRVLRHQQDAEDAFQATFIVLARRAADVWPREAVASWLFGVAHRVALKARAARGRRTAREQPLEEVAGADRPAPDFDLADAVHRVVSRLPEVYRAAVVACDLQGLSRKEAAERLGWPEGTLSGRLARARALLASRLRRAGLALPAGGLAAVLAAHGAASAAAVQTAIDLATGPAGAAPAPVAALTEGVVRSMALFKFKATAAAVLAACAIGFGAFAAAGAGRGDGDGSPGDRPPAAGPAVPLAPVAAPPAAPTRPAAEKKPAPASDRERLQGTWRIVALTEGGKTTATNPRDPWVVEVAGGTIRMPYLETAGGWKQREYSFAVDEAATPRTIDLVAKNAPLGRGIYEFTLPSGQCAACHQHPFAAEDAKRLGFLAVCAPVLKDPRKMGDAGVRLALSIDGKRPEKFGGAGVIVFELQRPDPQAEARARLAEAQKQLSAAATAAEKRSLEAKLEDLRRELDELVVRETRQQAEAELRRAQANLARARAQAAAAQAEVAQATVTLELARERLAVAERALADAKKPKGGAAPDAGPAFTVHVRALTAPEKVIRVKATGNTVLDGLVYAADDVSIKSDAVSVWVVRDGAVLPVDLPGITKNGDAKTNYVLKADDRLFVQARPAK